MPSSPSSLVGQDWLFGIVIWLIRLMKRVFLQLFSAVWFKACYDNQKPTPDFPSTPGVIGDPSFTSTSSFTINAEEPFTHLSTATANPGSPTAFVASGLPSGLILNPSDGNLSGVPTTAGYYESFYQAIYDDGSQALQAYDFTILPRLPKISFVSSQLVGANSLKIFYELTATGGDEPTVYLVADTVDQGKDLYKWKYRKNLGKLGLGSGSFILSGLDVGKLYYLRLNAINSVGEDWTGKDSEVRL